MSMSIIVVVLSFGLFLFSPKFDGAGTHPPRQIDSSSFNFKLRVYPYLNHFCLYTIARALARTAIQPPSHFEFLFLDYSHVLDVNIGDCSYR